MKRVLKWSVPVDGRTHPIGAGKVVHVACQYDASTVQVWTEETQDDATPTGLARVYATGQAIASDAEHVGVAIAQGFVWHVYRSAP